MAVGDYPIEDLAAFLDAALPDGVQVYGHPADIGKLPAVVMVPGDPAIAVVSMDEQMTLGWGCECTLIVSRSQVLYAQRAIQDLWRQVAAALITYQPGTVTILTLETVGELDWSGGEAMAGTMPLILTIRE